MPNKIVQLIDNEDNNIYPVAGSLAQGSVTTSTINDGAVTAAKIDFTTMPGNYSASEIDTGYTWVDGKHIYKKTVSIGQCPNQDTKTIPSGISDMDKLIRLEGMAYSDSAVFCFGPSLATFYTDTLALGGGSWNLSYQKSANTISLATGTDRSSCTAYATLYYTKTS